MPKLQKKGSLYSWILMYDLVQVVHGLLHHHLSKQVTDSTSLMTRLDACMRASLGKTIRIGFALRLGLVVQQGRVTRRLCRGGSGLVYLAVWLLASVCRNPACSAGVAAALPVLEDEINDRVEKRNFLAGKKRRPAMYKIGFDSKVIDDNRTCKITKGGQVAKYTTLLATGNYHSIVGFAKAKGPTTKIAKHRV